jgi:hypothetical protein
VVQKRRCCSRSTTRSATERRPVVVCAKNYQANQSSKQFYAAFGLVFPDLLILSGESNSRDQFVRDAMINLPGLPLDLLNFGDCAQDLNPASICFVNAKYFPATCQRIRASELRSSNGNKKINNQEKNMIVQDKRSWKGQQSSPPPSSHSSTPSQVQMPPYVPICH